MSIVHLFPPLLWILSRCQNTSTIQIRGQRAGLSRLQWTPSLHTASQGTKPQKHRLSGLHWWIWKTTDFTLKRDYIRATYVSYVKVVEVVRFRLYVKSKTIFLSRFSNNGKVIGMFSFIKYKDDLHVPIWCYKHTLSLCCCQRMPMQWGPSYLLQRIL